MPSERGPDPQPPRAQPRTVAPWEQPLPYVLCVIDELADLMMISPAEVGGLDHPARPIALLGIHLVLAHPRPSADVITGMDQVHVPARIAFRRLLPDRLARDPGHNGAESLLVRGTCCSGPPASRARRIRAPSSRGGESRRSPTTGAARSRPECRRSCSRPWSPGGKGVRGSGLRLQPRPRRPSRRGHLHLVQMGTASTSMLSLRLRVGYNPRRQAGAMRRAAA